MHPILLMGHTRALTKIKFNFDGDLLFSVSKDPQPSVWYSESGERLGTFDGHQGAIWDLDVSIDSKFLLTASGDNSCRLWDVYTGKELFKFNTKTAVRSVMFSHGCKQAVFVTDATMGQVSTLHVVNLHLDDLAKQTEKVDFQIVVKGAKATTAKWGKLNKTIITGHEDGTVSVYDGKVSFMANSF